MSFLDLLKTPSLAEPVRMEPFIPPDLSALTDRELLEMQTQAMLKTEHTIGQILMTAQSSPLLASFLPKP